MITITIGIGLPASGKTTELKKRAQESAAVYICPDDIRGELTGSRHDQSKNKQVWQMAHERLHEAVGQGKDVVFDATNAKKMDRRLLLQQCRLPGVRIVGIWFITPTSVCLERNRARQVPIPEFTMGRMAGWLEALPPKMSEGFDLIMRFNAT